MTMEVAGSSEVLEAVYQAGWFYVAWDRNYRWTL